MTNARIAGIASYLPDDILDNDMLSKMVDTNDEWITTRVGIKERRILKKPVGSSYMGIIAVQRLLESTGVNPDDIDLVICPTSNPDYRFPSTASVITYGVGLKHCYAYDIQAACAGFLVGCNDAAAYLEPWRSSDARNYALHMNAYDILMRVAAASTSAEARDAYLKDAEQLLLDSGNIIPLYSRQQPYQIREGVAGAVNDGLGAWYFGSVRRVTQ